MDQKKETEETQNDTVSNKVSPVDDMHKLLNVMVHDMHNLVNVTGLKIHQTIRELQVLCFMKKITYF